MKKKNLLLDFHKKTKIVLKKNNDTETDYPLTWIKIFFKSYPRFKSIKLLKPKVKKISLDVCLLKRESFRDFTNKPLKKQEFSDILYYSSGIINKHKVKNWDETRRTFPSAGARYPLETYIIIFNVIDIPSGIYHYNVKNNSLECISVGDFRLECYNAIIQPLIKTCSCLILISSVFDRTRIKYGDRAYRYILFDTGHLMQNIYLESASLDIGCCAIGGFSDNKINSLLDLKEEEEAVIYISALGVKK